MPQIRLTSTSNWFDLTGKHGEQTTETTDMVRMARKLQTARSALNRICDTHAFPPNELELLSSRLDQLEALLPMRTHQVTLPFEGDLTASEIFTSSSAALAPRLLTWYGEPPKKGTRVVDFPRRLRFQRPGAQGDRRRSNHRRYRHGNDEPQRPPHRDPGQCPDQNGWREGKHETRDSMSTSPRPTGFPTICSSRLTLRTSHSPLRNQLPCQRTA